MSDRIAPPDGSATPPDGPRPGQGPSGFRRDEALRRLEGERFDVLVVGGGVTGAGVALDAASRGLRTALVEKGDFASGTSSKSSKMVHGGIRYLQQREIRLVYENLAERQRLLENAPHLVSPLPFLIPLFGRDGVVSKTVARSYATALWLYDLTGGIRIGSRHRRVGKAEALAHLPTLRTDHLVAGFLYFDARADDVRLTLALVRTAVLDYGAVAANYSPVVSFLADEGGRVEGVRVRPAVRLAEADAAGEKAEDHDIDVRATVVVNAAGVWADDVRALDEHAYPHSIRPAKGVHVTVPAAKLPCDIAAVVPVRKDKRSVFVVPWPEAELVYVGTTDTDYSGPLDDPACTPEDVDYLLSAVNAVTTSALTRADVTGVWAGLRPLLAPPESGPHQSERTSDLSRRHMVRTSPHGVVTVTGGKLTTYRKMAEDAMAEVVPMLPAGAVAKRCVTKKLRLRGAPRPGGGLPGAGASPPGPVQAHLQARYGTEVGAVLAVAEGRPELLEPVIEGLPYLGAEVVYAARAEMAVTLDDVLSRRTRALPMDARRSADAAAAVAELLAPELGWTPEEVAERAASFAGAALAELDAAGLPVGGVAPGSTQ
jgi:glycerol-3-phosphate dehydrogenase